MSEIPPELFDEMTLAVRTFVEVLLLRIAELEKRVEQREAKRAKNSRNSSKPPSIEHPHAKPLPKKKPKVETQTGRTTWTSDVRTDADPDRRVRRDRPLQAGPMSWLRQGASLTRRTAAAAAGVGC